VLGGVSSKMFWPRIGKAWGERETEFRLNGGEKVEGGGRKVGVGLRLAIPVVSTVHGGLIDGIGAINSPRVPGGVGGGGVVVGGGVWVCGLGFFFFWGVLGGGVVWVFLGGGGVWGVGGFFGGFRGVFWPGSDGPAPALAWSHSSCKMVSTEGDERGQKKEFNVV